MSPFSAWRWILLGPLTFAAMIASGFILSAILGPRIVFDEPVVGFLTAFVTVGTAYFIAPTYKLSAATCYFLIGAALACWILRSTTYPEDHPKAYQPTMIPLYMTLLGGIISLGLATAKEKMLTGRSS